MNVSVQPKPIWTGKIRKSNLRHCPRNVSFGHTWSTCTWTWLDPECSKEPIKLPLTSPGYNLALLTANIMAIHSLTKRETIKMEHLHLSIFQGPGCSAQWSVGSEALAVDTCSAAILIIHPLSALAFVIQNKHNCLLQRGGCGAR